MSPEHVAATLVEHASKIGTLDKEVAVLKTEMQGMSVQMGDIKEIAQKAADLAEGVNRVCIEIKSEIRGGQKILIGLNLLILLAVAIATFAWRIHGG